jgi:PAS domain S-box-containing protein
MSGELMTTKNIQGASVLPSIDEIAEILTNGPAVMYVTGTDDYAATYISPNVETQIGYKPNDFTDDASFWASRIHPEDAAQVFDGLQSLLENGHHTLEYRFRLKDGGYRWMHDEAKLIRAPDGEPRKIVGHWIDITERKKIEEALRKSEASLANAQRIACLGNWDWDIVNNGLYWSDEIYRIFGLREREFGETYDAFLNSVHPDDRALVQKSVDAALNEGAAYSIDHRIVLPGGEIRIVHEQGEIVRDEGGRPVQMNGTVQDVTEERQAAEALHESDDRLRLVADALPLMIYYMDNRLRYRFVSKEAANWYARPISEVIGQSAESIMGKANVASMLPYFEDVLSGKGVTFDKAITYPDGVTRQVHTIYVPHVTDPGEVAGFFGLVVDQTERTALEESLRQSQKMEAVGQLTGGIAHDFNNLLAVVIGNLEMVADHLQADTPAFDFVRNAFTAAERGASLTHNLLAFSRQQVLQPEETDLAKLIGETKALISISMGEKIVMEIQTGDNLWRCKVDQAQLQNAILNLSINARDAMSSGGDVTISAENTPLDAARAEALELDEGDYVCLSITDNGPGIPDEVIEHVFEPFFTTKGAGEGSGLGLSMVYGFVQQSGGCVDIETGEGEGTSVRLYFPAIVPDEAEAVEIDAERQSGLTAPNATILLVEDNAAFREITRTILESLNYRVIDFGTAEEALTVIGDTTRFDLMLSDIGLPGEMNGHELAEYAASARPSLKIVLMSANTDSGVIGGLIDSNVSAFLRKPHRKADLSQTLRRVLGLDTLAT